MKFEFSNFPADSIVLTNYQVIESLGPIQRQVENERRHVFLLYLFAVVFAGNLALADYSKSTCSAQKQRCLLPRTCGAKSTMSLDTVRYLASTIGFSLALDYDCLRFNGLSNFDLILIYCHKGIAAIKFSDYIISSSNCSIVKTSWFNVP